MTVSFISYYWLDLTYLVEHGLFTVRFDSFQKLQSVVGVSINDVNTQCRVDMVLHTHHIHLKQQKAQQNNLLKCKFFLITYFMIYLYCLHCIWYCRYVRAKIVVSDQLYYGRPKAVPYQK